MVVLVLSSSTNSTLLVAGSGSLFFSDALGRARLSNIMKNDVTAVMSKMK